MFSFDMIMDKMSYCTIVSTPQKSGMFDMLIVGAGCEKPLTVTRSSCVNDEEGQRKVDRAMRFDMELKTVGHDERVLFVGGVRDARVFLAQNPSSFVLVVLEETLFPAELESCRERCFVIGSHEKSAAEVVLDVQLICNGYQRWQDDLKASLIEKGSYQQLFDRSESVLMNFISLTDSSFRLIAYTHGVEPQDEISRRLIQNGYHDVAAIDFFKKDGLFERWGRESGLHVYERTPTSQTESASYIFRMRGSYFMHVVMRFNRHPRTKGFMDTFSIFISYLEILVRREWQGARMRGNSYSRTLIGLISGKLTKSTLIEEELSVADIQKDSAFLVMCFSPNEKTQKTSENERPYFLRMLATEFSQAKIVEYGETIVALFELTADKGAGSWDEREGFEKSIVDGVAAFLNVHGGLCGSSNMILSVYGIRYGYLQALYALSRCLSPVIAPGEKASSFLTSFKEAYLDFLLYGRTDNKELALFCREHGVVELISADDKNEGTDNLEVLITYLLNERRATKAAAALYMHRNSLLYRVESLCKKYHLDFDFYAQRQTFLLEYHFMLEHELMR